MGHHLRDAGLGNLNIAHNHGFSSLLRPVDKYTRLYSPLCLGGDDDHSVSQSADLASSPLWGV